MQYLPLYIFFEIILIFCFRQTLFLFFYLRVFGNEAQCCSNVDPPQSSSKEYSTKFSLSTKHKT